MKIIGFGNLRALGYRWLWLLDDRLSLF